MTYLALYRAWRPQSFEDVIGQTHITKTLQNALKEQRFSHAYLFNGPRGTGKTSTAKIFAKAVNCENGPSAEPCNECSTCRGISDGSILEVVEIDAASNRGVEEIRDLREKVRFAPSQVKYKVYIIDEVHMLTTEAFNALLKTLEEPPEHVVFILATTEPHKLPATIISRCQRFDFKRISSSTIANRLQKIVEKEGYIINEDAVLLISQHAEGGMRDALSLLDQVLSYSDGNITLDDVLKVTGRLSHQLFSQLAKFVYEGNTNQVLENIDHYIEDGKDPEKIIEDFLFYYRDMLLYRSAPSLDNLKEKVILDEDFPQTANMYTEDLLYEIIEILNRYLNDIKWTNQPRVILELALIRITGLNRQKSSDSVITLEVKELKNKLKQLEDHLQNLQTMPTQTSQVVSEETKPTKTTKTKVSQNNTSSHLLKLSKSFDHAEYQQILENWPTILQKVKDEKITVHAWLVDGEPVAVTSNEIIIAFKNDMHRITTEKPANRQLIEQVIEQIAGKKLQIITLMKKEWKQYEEKLGSTSQEAENSSSVAEDDIVTKAIEFFGEDMVVIKD